MTLQEDDLQRVAHEFGVSDLQVRRDHLITHLLAALSSSPLGEELIFFGGTALSKTHLVDGRLSEDIDLIALTPRRKDLAERVDNLLPRAAMRQVGRLRWEPSLSAVRAVDSAVLVSPEGLRIRVQLLPNGHYPAWPTEHRAIHSHYRDVSAGTLTVPTRDAFVGWKTSAWADRRAPRDLWDLHALASVGAFTDEAAQLYRRLGPTGHVPGAWLFGKLPDDVEWAAALAGQTRLVITVQQAARAVRDAWARFA